MNGKSVLVAYVLFGMFAGGALCALWAAGDVARYLYALPTSKLANPPRTANLIGSLAILLPLIVFLVASASRIRNSGSVHRRVAADWPLWSVALWSLVVWYALLVNYPVPPQAHHVDKFLLGCVILLLWSVWFAIWPQSLARSLTSRPSEWLRIGLVNVLVFAVLGEVVFRLADPLIARNGLFGDKHTPAHLKPHMPVRGSVGTTNSQGFRDRERVFARIHSAPRAIALGDSFTWGAGVSYDETFITLLERRLQAVVPGSEVINLGVPGWGPHEERHLLEVYGIRFAPDLVLLNFLISNDIQNLRADDFNLQDILVVGGQSYYVHRNGNWVHDALGPSRWYLYHNLNFLWTVGASQVLHLAERRNSAPREGAMPSEWVPLMSRSQYLRGIRERSDIYLKQDTPFFARHWNRTQVTLLGIRDYLRMRNIPLLMVLIPDHLQLDRGLQEEYFAFFGESPDRYDFQKPQRLLRAWCAENGVAVIDLLPAFQAEGTPGNLYFRNDIHWTAAGHKLAAAAIFPMLEAQLAGRKGTRLGGGP